MRVLIYNKIISGKGEKSMFLKKCEAYKAVLSRDSDRKLLDIIYKMRFVVVFLGAILGALLGRFAPSLRDRPDFSFMIIGGIYLLMTSIFLGIYLSKTFKTKENNENSEQYSKDFAKKINKLFILDLVFLGVVCLNTILLTVSFSLAEYFSHEGAKIALGYFFTTMKIVLLVEFLVVGVILYFKQRNFLRNSNIINEYNRRAEELKLPKIKVEMEMQDFSDFLKNKEKTAVTPSNIEQNSGSDECETVKCDEFSNCAKNDKNSTKVDEERNFFEDMNKK